MTKLKEINFPREQKNSRKYPPTPTLILQGGRKKMNVCDEVMSDDDEYEHRMSCKCDKKLFTKNILLLPTQVFFVIRKLEKWTYNIHHEC